ncbi:MAG: phage coat protein [Clostridia bacterium]|nr:phage coat protein [Clostridia bacterium]
MPDTKPNVSVFDGNTYNPQAFGRYIESLPKERENALLNANIFESDEQIRDMFANQSTTAYGVIPVKGDFKGESQNYDGETDLKTGDGVDTYYYGVHSYGRAVVGTEKDFTKDLIPGLDPLDQIASKFAERWDDINEDTIIAILNGIFASTDPGAQEFAQEHTFEVNGTITEDAIYDATQKACGDKNKKFKLAIMHSKVATELAKKQLLEYIKYTDSQGIQRNTNIAQWGDKTVLIDDAYTIESKTTTTGSGENTVTTTTIKYITYVLGEGLFKREPMPVDVPFERDREALKAGGTTNLISRQRRVVHPKGFSYLMANQATKSPTDAEFADGANWGLMQNAKKDKYYPHKFIPLCKIVSK